MNRIPMILALAAVCAAGPAQADPLGQVFEATVVGVDASPSLSNASQETPLSVKLRFDNDQCWAVADVVPMVGKTNNNISGRLRGVDCTDGRFRGHRGFAAGYLDPSGIAPATPAGVSAEQTAAQNQAAAQPPGTKPTAAKTSSVWIAVFF